MTTTAAAGQVSYPRRADNQIFVTCGGLGVMKYKALKADEMPPEKRMLLFGTEFPRGLQWDSRKTVFPTSALHSVSSLSFLSLLHLN